MTTWQFVFHSVIKYFIAYLKLEAAVYDFSSEFINNTQ